LFVHKHLIAVVNVPCAVVQCRTWRVL